MPSHLSPQNPGMPPRPQPKFKITWWMLFRSKIRYLHTPLNLRGSVKRLRHEFPHPYFELFKLFIKDLQMPSWNWSYDLPLPKPLAPEDIIGNEDLFYDHNPNIWGLRYIPIWVFRDNPLRSIYRLYEIFMTREFVLLRLECEYFFRRTGKKWALQSIPDPRDPDPIRYAMLASIVDELVDAFNYRLKHGMRRNRKHVHRSSDNPWPAFEPEVRPSWTVSVPPIRAADLHRIPPEYVQQGRLILDDAGVENFLARNWDACNRYLHTA